MNERRFFAFGWMHLLDYPLLGVFGYHFFEVTIEGDITYVLITRQNITDCKAVSQVVQLTEYMILEANHAQ